MSRPTASAVELGRALNMKLACMGGKGVLVFSGEERLKAEAIQQHVNHGKFCKR